MNLRAKLSDYFRQRNRGLLLALFAAACIVYLPFLGNPFVFDDLPFFSDNNAEIYTHSLFQLELRWLPYASLGWTAAIFSDVLTYPFRLGNMLLHIANAILLFFLLRQLVGAVSAKHENSTQLLWGAWLGALAFAVHPVAVYAVGYVVERTILMATLFALVMQLAYVRGLLTGQKRWLALAVVAYFLSGFSKEHSVLMPAVLAVQTILLRDKNKLGKPALWLTWLAFTAIAVLLALNAMGVVGTSYEIMAPSLFKQESVVASAPMLHLLSALTQSGLFFKYLLLWLLPSPAWMSVDMREPFVASLSTWQGWAGALAFLLYGALACRLLLRGGLKGLAGLALLYPWLLFGVEFSSIRVQEIFVLYRSYLWMPGIMLLFPLLLINLSSGSQNNYKKPFGLSLSKAGDNTATGGSTSSPRTAIGLTERSARVPLGLGLIIILLIPLSWNRLGTLSDNYRLWNDAALLLHSERQMGADRIFYNRGNAELSAKKWDEAAVDFQRAVTLSPQLAPIHYALGLTYANTKRYEAALAQFDAAIALEPDAANYYYAKAFMLKQLHQDDLAMQQMEKSCALKNITACLIVQMDQRRK